MTDSLGAEREALQALRNLVGLIGDFQSTHDYTEWWDTSPGVIRARALLDRVDRGAGNKELMVVNPASGVTMPMREAWQWACVRVELLEAALRGDEHALASWRGEESVRGAVPLSAPASEPPSVDTDSDIIQEMHGGSGGLDD